MEVPNSVSHSYQKYDNNNLVSHEFGEVTGHKFPVLVQDQITPFFSALAYFKGSTLITCVNSGNEVLTHILKLNCTI